MHICLLLVPKLACDVTRGVKEVPLFHVYSANTSRCTYLPTYLELLRPCPSSSPAPQSHFFNQLRPRSVPATMVLVQLLHVPQAALSAYGLYMSYISITNLRQYEEKSEKAAKWSGEAERQLHKTRTTQATGALSVCATQHPSQARLSG